MIKFYKNQKHYAEENNLCRQTVSKRIKNGEINLTKIPKGIKYYEELILEEKSIDLL